MNPHEQKLLAGLTALSDFSSKVETIWHALDDDCADKDYHVILAEGPRSSSDQLAKYAQGRVKVSDGPAPWGTWKQTGSVVTRAKPDQSAHCFRAAADLAFVYDAGPEAGHWIPRDVRTAQGTFAIAPAWELLAMHARSHDLETGRDWPSFIDCPHVQLHGWADLVRTGALGKVA